MKFQTYKEELQHHQSAAERLREATQLEWLLPDKLGLLLVNILVPPAGVDDESRIQISSSTWRDEPESTVQIKNGPTIKGAYFDHHYDALAYANKNVLAYVIAARNYCDKWIAGEIDDLPLQPFV